MITKEIGCPKFVTACMSLQNEDHIGSALQEDATHCSLTLSSAVHLNIIISIFQAKKWQHRKDRPKVSQWEF